jgi:hypothetical protein
MAVFVKRFLYYLHIKSCAFFQRDFTLRLWRSLPNKLNVLGDESDDLIRLTAKTKIIFETPQSLRAVGQIVMNCISLPSVRSLTASKFFVTPSHILRAQSLNTLLYFQLPRLPITN